MDNLEYGEIPSRLDDPPKFIWWDFDVAILFMGFLIFGVVTEFFFTFIFLGFFLAYSYQKVKTGKHKAFGIHLVYWYLPVTMGMKTTPPSAIREFIG
jgi:conjugal transfer pilus assembly protein TraL